MSITFKFAPLAAYKVENICITRDDVFASISCCTSKDYYLGFGDLGDCVAEASEGHLPEYLHFLKHISIEENFFL